MPLISLAQQKLRLKDLPRWGKLLLLPFTGIKVLPKISESTVLAEVLSEVLAVVVGWRVDAFLRHRQLKLALGARSSHDAERVDLVLLLHYCWWSLMSDQGLMLLSCLILEQDLIGCLVFWLKKADIWCVAKVVYYKAISIRSLADGVTFAWIHLLN